MPLLKSSSKKAMSKNIATEMNAGKPQKQSIAIAYDVARHSRKKMSHGGSIGRDHIHTADCLAMGGSCYATGGKLPKLGTGKRFENLEHSLAHEKGVHDAGAIAASIGRKKYGKKKFSALSHHKKMAEGGEVDLGERMDADDARTDRDEDMLMGKKPRHEDEMNAGMMRADADNAADERDEDMLRKHFAEGGRADKETDFATESRPSADRDEDSRGKSRGFSTKENAGDKANWLNEREVTIDEDQDEEDKHRGINTKTNDGDDVDFENEGHPDADNEEEKMSTGMMHQENELDEYSKEGLMNYADGGDVDDVVEHIMKKRRRMAEGGEVDLGANADEEYNHEDQDSFDALRKENYSESPMLDETDSPMDSNEHGHDLSDEDEHGLSLIDSIRKRMKARRGM